MVKLIILFSLLFTLSAAAQLPDTQGGQNSIKDSSGIHEEQDSAKNRIILKWTPTAVVGFFPALQIGGEYFFKPDGSVQFEYGWMKPVFGWGIASNRGHRLSIEARKYFTETHRWYVAAGMNFEFSDLIASESFSNWEYDSALEMTIYRDLHTENIGVKRIVSGMNLKGGFQVYADPQETMTFNIYLGLGLISINNIWKNTPAGQHTPVQNVNGRYTPIFYEGVRYYLQPMAGITVGCRIR